MDFLALSNLTVSFDQYPRSGKILDYFAYPRIPITDVLRLTAELRRHLNLRSPFSEVQKAVSGFSWAPQDSSIFRRRFKLVETNNRAYSLLQKQNPSVAEIEELSEIDPCWSTLFPIKIYLSHHMDVARRYRGMVPFGGYVERFYNQINIVTNGYPKVKGTPAYRDHDHLRQITVMLADRYNLSVITVNDIMYVEGSKLSKER